MSGGADDDELAPAGSSRGAEVSIWAEALGGQHGENDDNEEELQYAACVLAMQKLRCWWCGCALRT